MRYLGGKYYVRKEIAEIINGQTGTVFLEPFMGACWITSRVKYRYRLAGDIHFELVEMFRRLQAGWMPPESITQSEYEDIRANKATGKYPPELVAFAGFGCAFGGSYFRDYAGEHHAARSCRSLLKKARQLQDVHFFCSDYRHLNPTGCVIYCDPPYGGCYPFRITGVRGNGSFDSKEFWEVMDRWSEQNLVFISEREAPADYVCLMDRRIKASLRSKDGCSIRSERLFCKNRNVRLVQDNYPEPLEVLGVAPSWNVGEFPKSKLELWLGPMQRQTACGWSAT